MKIPVRDRKWGLRFNITPLIDIVFLLIIFFLAASHFVRSEMLEAVELPRASQVEQSEREAPRRLVVTITDDDSLHVGGREVDLDRVEQLIVEGRQDGKTDFVVRLRSDRVVAYRIVEPVMLACARAGVSNVKFAVIREQ